MEIELNSSSLFIYDSDNIDEIEKNNDEQEFIIEQLMKHIETLENEKNKPHFIIEYNTQNIRKIHSSWKNTPNFIEIDNNKYELYFSDNLRSDHNHIHYIFYKKENEYIAVGTRDMKNISGPIIFFEKYKQHKKYF
jgi:hypothetical protein